VTFRLLATPYEGDFFGLAETLACHHLADLINEADRAAAIWGELPVSTGLSPVSTKTLSTRCWSPELGSLRQSLSDVSNQARWSRARVQYAMCAYLLGLAATIDVDAVEPLTLFVGGEAISLARGCVKGTDGQLRIEELGSSLLRQFRRVKDDGLAAVWLCQDSRPPLRLGTGARAIRATPGWMRSGLSSEEASTTEGLQGDDDEVLAMVERAVSFLESSDLAYYVWVVALLREIVPLREYTSGTRSASFVNWPGHIHISKASLIPTVIALIHECSHQYYHLASWCGPLTTPDAPQVHSVLKDRTRPLDKILLGFHAFGNVLLALTSIESSLDESMRYEWDRQVGHHLGLVRGLDEGLRLHWESGLTQNGKEIYLHLRKRVAEASLL
jgi:HEXXH motif-containing protein